MLDASTARHPIRVVARRTGLKPELIRAWERRYRAVQPARSRGNQRLYSDHDVERLRLLRQATEGGHAISRLADLDDDALRQMVQETSEAPSVDGLRRDLEAAVSGLEDRALRRLLSRASEAMDPVPLVVDLIAPLMRWVGEAWQEGRLRPVHEHLATSAVRALLSSLMNGLESAPSAPPLVVTTPAGQRHDIGALGTAVVASIAGWRVVYLGADLPATEIATAARATGAEAVALSLVYPDDDDAIGDELGRLRDALGDTTEILVGGSGAPAYEAALAASGARRVGDLRELEGILAGLRQRRAAAMVTPHALPLRRAAVQAFDLGPCLDDWGGSSVGAVRRVSEALRAARRQDDSTLPAAVLRPGLLNAVRLVQGSSRQLLDRYRRERCPDLWRRCFDGSVESFGRERVERLLEAFDELFAVPPVVRAEDRFADLLLLWLANHNPAFEPFRFLFDDAELEAESAYREVITGLRPRFAALPPAGASGASVLDLLTLPMHRAPNSLEGQLAVLLKVHSELAGEITDRLHQGLDILREEQRPGFVGGPPVPEVRPLPALDDAADYRPEAPWMRAAVMQAKIASVWLHQLSRNGAAITRLDQVPAAELARLADLGVTTLWLIGIWRRSRASQQIKRRCGRATAVASAYSLDDYVVAEELGGEAALEALAQRAADHGLRLACDVVPNHMGIDSRWLLEHPEWFLAVDRPPFRSYRFSGPDLSPDPAVGIFLEDGYYDRSDAAVVFRHLDRASGRERFVYHGNDGTSLPWNDTAQIDYLDGDAREAMIATIVAIAKRFAVIRFDAAMTLARRHVQRLWHPERGDGGAIPSRAEHGVSADEFLRRMPEEFWRQVVERVAAEAPDTLLVAEAFWMMEEFFVRRLGLHRVYNSALMHDLKAEDNGKIQRWLVRAYEREPELLGRMVNYLTTPDEESAAAQFGKGDKYFAACTLVATLPGLPLIGHGQFEGRTEKYAMDLLVPRYSEASDGAVFERHRRQIAPLLARRELFSDVASFRLLRATTVAGDEAADVFAFAHPGRALVVVHNHPEPLRVALAGTWPRRRGDDSETSREPWQGALGLTTARRLVDLEGRRSLAVDPRDAALEIDLGPYETLVFLFSDKLPADPAQGSSP